MRWTSSQLFIAAAGALAALILPAAAPAAPADDSTNSPPDTLLLRNGDSLDGKLLSIDPAQGARWKHADAVEPMVFKLDRISELDLHPPPAPDRGTNAPCKVTLAGGDTLEGSLVSGNRESLCLQTWYAGQLTFPRKQVQSISFLPTTPDIFTLTGAAGWTLGNTVGALGATAGQWTFRDGAFYTSKSASVARDIKLPDTADLQFDLAWTGELSLSVALYTDSLQPMVIADKDKMPDFGAFYSMIFKSVLVQMARIKKMETPVIYLPIVVVSSLGQTNRAHIEVRARKKTNTLALAVDGQWLQVWNDTNGFCGEGTGVRFVHNGEGLVKVSNLRLAPWDGVFEAGATNPPPAGQDVAWLTNGLSMAGVIESVADAKLTLRGKKETVELPLEQLARLTFASAQEEPPKEADGTVHAVLVHGGPVRFQLESWTPEGVSVRSPVFGRAKFDPGAFRRLVFRPLDAVPGSSPDN
jgi:hypothetical protein